MLLTVGMLVVVGAACPQEQLTTMQAAVVIAVGMMVVAELVAQTAMGTREAKVTGEDSEAEMTADVTAEDVKVVVTVAAVMAVGLKEAAMEVGTAVASSVVAKAEMATEVVMEEVVSAAVMAAAAKVAGSAELAMAAGSVEVEKAAAREWVAQQERNNDIPHSQHCYPHRRPGRQQGLDRGGSTPRWRRNTRGMRLPRIHTRASSTRRSSVGLVVVTKMATRPLEEMVAMARLDRANAVAAKAVSREVVAMVLAPLAKETVPQGTAATAVAVKELVTRMVAEMAAVTAMAMRAVAVVVRKLAMRAAAETVAVVWMANMVAAKVVSKVVARVLASLAKATAPQGAAMAALVAQ